MKRQAQITHQFWLTQGTSFRKPFFMAWMHQRRSSETFLSLSPQTFCVFEPQGAKKTRKKRMKLPPTSFWHISWRYQEANGCSDGLWTPASVTLALIPAMISRWALWKLPVQDIILWGLFIDVYLEPCKNRILNLMPSCLSDYFWIHLYLGHDFGCCGDHLCHLLSV